MLTLFSKKKSLDINYYNKNDKSFIIKLNKIFDGEGGAASGSASS